MNEQDIERGLAQLKETWRVAGPPPLDRMWEAIEPAAFSSPARTPSRWLRTLLPLAAMLVIGFGLGRFASAPGRTSADGLVETGLTALPAAASSEARPFVGVATNYLERVTALLLTLAGESGRGQPVEYKASQARDLLATTRLLMDSPDPIEPQLRVLRQMGGAHAQGRLRSHRKRRRQRAPGQDARWRTTSKRLLPHVRSCGLFPGRARAGIGRQTAARGAADRQGPRRARYADGFAGHGSAGWTNASLRRRARRKGWNDKPVQPSRGVMTHSGIT